LYALAIATPSCSAARPGHPARAAVGVGDINAKDRMILSARDGGDGQSG